MPDSPDASPAALPALQTAARLVAAGRLAEAEDALHRLVAEAPAYAAAYALLARVLESDGQPATALEAWHRAAFLVPSSPLVHRERQRLLAALPRPPAAEAPEASAEAAPSASEHQEGSSEAVEASAESAGPSAEGTEASETSDEASGVFFQGAEASAEGLEPCPEGPHDSTDEPEASEPEASDEGSTQVEAFPAENPEASDSAFPDDPEGSEGADADKADGPSAHASHQVSDQAFVWDRDPSAEGEPDDQPSAEASDTPSGTYAEGTPFPSEAPGVQEASGEPARWAEDDADALPAWDDLPTSDVDIAPPLFEASGEDDDAGDAGTDEDAADGDGWAILNENEADDSAWAEPVSWDAPPDVAPPAQPPADFAVADELDALIRTLSDAPRIRPDPSFSAPDAPVGQGEGDEVVSETLARIYAAQHQFEQAAQAYEKLAAQRPGEAERLLAEAAAMRSRA